jgi:mono/diheme cytochrome c family protein|tara:strand:+ start:105 stop:503 length:399 start_codon:yes stop_codon:yes gene_type:complete
MQVLKNSKSVFALALILPIWFVSTSYAQTKTIKDGVYTEAQLAAGQNAYEANCNACHDIKFYRDIWKGWIDKPLLNFWYIIVAEMPADNPGSLLDTEYTNIVANILSEMGFPSGESVLDPNDGMDEINIVAP